MITERGTLIHWNYFIALDDDAANISRYVEFTKANFSTYSIEFSRLLMAASSEVDVVSKMLCKKIDANAKAENIVDYRTIIKPARPKIITYKILIPRFGLELIPWQNWKTDNSPDWWHDYNAVKHERNVSFDKANLSNALNSIAALYVLLLFYYQEEAENGFLNPIPNMFSVSGEYIRGHGIDSNGVRMYYWF